MKVTVIGNGVLSLSVAAQVAHKGDEAVYVDLSGKYSTDIENSSDFHRILYAARNAWYELSQGVTTLRDLCSVGRTASALKDAITKKIIRGPRLYVCGIGAVAEKERKNGNTILADIICEEVVFPQLESIKKAYEKGILIGTGTDTAGDMCEELLLLEKAGLSRYQALQCATLNASKIVENNIIGTIECGKIADLVLLNSNPLDDLHNIRTVNTVVFEGEVVNEQWMCNLQ